MGGTVYKLMKIKNGGNSMIDDDRSLSSRRKKRSEEKVGGAFHRLDENNIYNLRSPSSKIYFSQQKRLRNIFSSPDLDGRETSHRKNAGGIGTLEKAFNEESVSSYYLTFNRWSQKEKRWKWRQEKLFESLSKSIKN